jgi:hypothetical protein
MWRAADTAESNAPTIDSQLGKSRLWWGLCLAAQNLVLVLIREHAKGSEPVRDRAPKTTLRGQADQRQGPRRPTRRLENPTQARITATEMTAVFISFLWGLPGRPEPSDFAHGPLGAYRRATSGRS